ncbi:MAG: hypothetical protein H9W81_17415 [Enterococcus sp.]|nr:hypothetical protein [Enterococcus sp.]
MAVAVSVSSQSTSKKKNIWAWVASEKNRKFGSSHTESAIVGNFIAIHSALMTIPSQYDIVIRTQYSSVAKTINDPTRTTKNPVVLKIFEIMKIRRGTVRAVVVTQATLSDNDKRAYKMTTTLSKGKAGSQTTKIPSVPGSLLSPSKTTKVKVTLSEKKAPVKRRKPKEILYTGVDEFDDDGKSVKNLMAPAAGKPVICESCDGPINPLTFECFCSV